ncbi:UNVERIFIED_CONTAM: hypothetical protein GTU68_002010 [Idotea baltica]|nr:hypothetical protein [Idotea baltica]
MSTIELTQGKNRSTASFAGSASGRRPT